MTKETEQLLTKAILDRDLDGIGQIVDQLRFAAGLNYEQTATLANRLTGISTADWEDLLYEVDAFESSS